MIRRALPVFVLSLLATSASADLVATVEHKDLPNDQTATGESQIGAKRVHMQGIGYGRRSTMIFQGDLERLLVLDDDAKTYTVLDEETTRQVSAQLTEAQKQMEAKLSQLPPEQAEMMRKMMSGAMSSLAAPDQPPAEIAYTASGDTEVIDGKSCQRYDVTVDGTLATQTWICSWKTAGVSPDEFQAMRDMMSFVQEFAAAMPLGKLNQETAGMQSIAAADGVPILMREIEDGEVVSEIRFVDFEHRDVPAASYEPPGDYRQQSLTEH